MKVRMSGIPEESGKPQRKSNKNWKVMKTKRVDPEDLEDEDDEEESEEEETESPEDKYIKSVLWFEDDGISIPLFGIESIETDMKFVEKPKAHWEFGIVINKDMTPSIRYPKVDVSMWFLNEEVRDNKMKKIMERFEKEGFNVIKV